MTIHQDARKLWSGDPQEVRATMAGHVRVQPAEESPMSEAKSSNHCVDCCCARAWKALGITEYTGLSIPEAYLPGHRLGASNCPV